jgi:hypothetical protein
LDGGDRHETGEFDHTIVIERIQGAPQRVSIEMRSFDLRGDEPVRRFVLEKQGHEIQLWVHNAQAVADHCLDSVAPGDHTGRWVLPGGLVNDGANAEFIKHPSHQAAMIQDLTAIWLWHGIDSSGEEILLLYLNYSKSSG